MDVRRNFNVFVLLAYLGTGQLLWSQSPHPKYDPTPASRASHLQSGFLDFTLKRINPSEYDYGQAIAIERDRLRRETTENAYFWSDVVAIGLLGIMFLVVSYQQRRLSRTAWEAAEVVAQYEYALHRANAEIENGSRRNHDLMTALIKLKETLTSPASGSSELVEPSLARELRKRADIASFVPDTTRNKAAKSAKNSVGAVVDMTAVPGTQIGLFKSEVDFIVKINSLEQQLAQSRDVESELRRRLNESGRRVQVEQEKNRTVKGG